MSISVSSLLMFRKDKMNYEMMKLYQKTIFALQKLIYGLLLFEKQ